MNKIIVDLDDTLFDISHRRKYYGEDWELYNKLMIDDEIIEPIYQLIMSLKNKYKIIILTGRYERYRNLTELSLYGNHVHYHELIMKNDEDNTSSVNFKMDWISRNCTPNDFVIDDRIEIQEECKKLKISIIIPPLIS